MRVSRESNTKITPVKGNVAVFGLDFRERESEQGEKLASTPRICRFRHRMPGPLPKTASPLNTQHQHKAKNGNADAQTEAGRGRDCHFRQHLSHQPPDQVRTQTAIAIFGSALAATQPRQTSRCHFRHHRPHNPISGPNGIRPPMANGLSVFPQGHFWYRRRIAGTVEGNVVSYFGIFGGRSNVGS